MRIMPFHVDYAAAVADTHRACIPEGFLSSLPPSFLTRLYRAIASARGSTVLLALDSSDTVSSGVDVVAGFAAFTADTNAMYREVLRKERLRFAMALAPKAFSAATIGKILETIRYGSGSDSTKGDSGPVAEILSIAVAQDFRGKGIGRALVGAVEQYMLSLTPPIREYKVVTSGADPHSNAFYRSCGFVQARTFEHHGLAMVEYRKTI